MKEPKVSRPDAVLQTRAEQDPQFAEDMWRFRHPEKDGQKLRVVDVLAELRDHYGLPVSLSTLSGFYKWLGLRRAFAESRNLIYQLKDEMKRDPSITLEAIERFGVIALATGGIQQKDGKLFAAMMKIGQNRTKLEQNDQKLGLQKQVVKLDERRLAILEAKASQADAAKEVLGTKLSPAEQNRRLREILK